MKTVVVFGSTSGIAEAFAREQAQAGSKLILVARNADKLALQKSDLIARGAYDVTTHLLDFLNFQSHPVFVAKIFAESVDIVLMAQGTMYDQNVAEKDFAKVKESIDLNYTSVASLCNAMIPHFEKQNKGQIAVITSVAGDRGRRSNFIYGSTKAAVQAYVSGLRGRLFTANVDVLDVRPGFVSTAMTAHLKKGLLTAEPGPVARGIVKALQRRKYVVYLPWFWCGIMSIIRYLPETIFKRLKF